MFNIKSSNFITSLQRNTNVKEINYLSSNSVKIIYNDNTFHTYVLDEHERIVYYNLNGEIIQKNEYDQDGNLIKTIECTEDGYEEVTYEENPIINPILKQRNGESIKFDSISFA